MMLDQGEWKFVDIPRFRESTGILSVLEIGTSFHFPVHRVFWINHVNSPHAVRGSHAHGELEQLIFCASGSCTIRLEGRTGARASLTLAEGGPALWLLGSVWRSMTNFTPDACMIVLCDREYALDTVVEDYEAWRTQ